MREDDEANESGEGENNKKEEEKDAEWNELTDTCPVNTESAELGNGYFQRQSRLQISRLGRGNAGAVLHRAQ